jgi:arginyl-tRNA synthetase
MIRDEIKTIVATAIQAAQADGTLPAFDLPAIEILRPKQAEHGDYSTNIAMATAAAVRKAGGNLNPRAVAEAHPGAFARGWHDRRSGDRRPWLHQPLAGRWLAAAAGHRRRSAGAAFGNIDRGRGLRWQVEFVSANPSGPIHYGGARNAVLGDSLANVLAAAGYTVQREYYVNDAGNQFNAFAASLYARYCQLFGRDEALPTDAYLGEYMIGYAQTVAASEGDRLLRLTRDEAIAELKRMGREIVLANLQRELASMGVHFDRWFSEQSLYDDGLVDQLLAQLQAQGDLAERDGAIWFLASNYLAKAKDEVVDPLQRCAHLLCQRHRLSL